MNLKTMFGIGLVSLGFAFAQDEANESKTSSAQTSTAQSLSEQELQKQEEQAASSESLTSPVPFVKPDIPKDSKRSPFNRILHGKAYNKNSNMAAANNTDLLLTYPNLFANRKFFYIEPTNKLGIVSLGSFFTAFDVSSVPQDSTLGRLTLGYAAPGFGFYIRAGLGRDRINSNDNIIKHTYGGDDWAFALSKGFMGLNVALNADWFTKKTQTTNEIVQYKVNAENRIDTLKMEQAQRYDSLTVNLSLTNAPTANNFTWTLGARLVISHDDITLDGDVDETKPVNSFWDIAPYIRGGLSVLENENARVLIGGAAILSYRNYNDPNELYVITTIFQPSMMGEVFVGESKNFMFFGEAGYEWVALQYQKNKDTDFSRIADKMDAVNATVGCRYQYKDFLAVEFGLEQKLFRSPGSIFQDTQTLANFSAMVRF